MAQQEPTIGVSIRIGVEMSKALDARCATLTAETGNPHQRTDVIRMALALYLGLVPEKPNGLEQPQPTT